MYTKQEIEKALKLYERLGSMRKVIFLLGCSTTLKFLQLLKVSAKITGAIYLCDTGYIQLGYLLAPKKHLQENPRC